MRANVGVLQGDVIGPIGAQAGPCPARIEPLPLHHEFRNAADGLSDPSGLLRGELAGTDAVTLRIVAVKEPSHRHRRWRLGDVTLGVLPDQGPWAA